MSHVDLENEIASDREVTVNTELLSVPGFQETAEVWSLSYEIWLFVDLYSANYKTSDLPEIAKQGETSTHWRSMQHKLCYTASANKKITAC